MVQPFAELHTYCAQMTLFAVGGILSYVINAGCTNDLKACNRTLAEAAQLVYHMKSGLDFYGGHRALCGVAHLSM